VDSPHLAERGYFVEIDHPEAGRLKYPSPGFLMDEENSMEGSKAAPTLGEHNSEILGGELGLSDEKLGQLRASQII
jgi:crotonobetainyl-CoA:carnitine CoA-transferase CaiB-like acyl-CoA transferase